MYNLEEKLKNEERKKRLYYIISIIMLSLGGDDIIRVVEMINNDETISFSTKFWLIWEFGFGGFYISKYFKEIDKVEEIKEQIRTRKK